MYTRLLCGISTITGIFQRVKENLLTGITYVIVRRDDILTSGKNDVEHLRNLGRSTETTIKCRRKVEKCLFMVPAVVYCGNKVTAGGNW